MTERPIRSIPGSPNCNQILDPHAKDAFWSVVEDCLETFHKYEKSRAHELAVKLRSNIESPPPGISGEFIYHDEPFYVACDLAEMHDARKKDRLLVKHRERYDSILSLRNW